MGITDYYFGLQDTYQRQYGDNTVVIIQVGSFYEIYEYDSRLNPDLPDDANHEHIGIATKIGNILNLILTKRNSTDQHSKTNPLMVGFPCIAYDKHKTLLLSHNYTIVRVDQKQPGKDDESSHNIERYVREIVSPGTDLEYSNANDASNNYVISLYIESQKTNIKLEDTPVISGVSCVDVSTGKNIVCEIYSKDTDHMNGFYEINRFLLVHNPREVIINLWGFDEKVDIEKYKQFIYETINLSKYPIVNIKNANKQIETFSQLNYQNGVFNSLFQNQTNRTNQTPQPNQTTQTTQTNQINIKNFNNQIIEFLGLEKLTYGRISYMLLIQYIYEHNSIYIKDLQKPDIVWIDSEKYLILMHNSISQLDIIPTANVSKMKAIHGNKTIDSLLSIVNNCCTPMGKRYAQNLLLNPITDIGCLNKMYDAIDELTQNSMSKISNSFKEIPDIEKYHRKIQLGVIKPRELSCLFNGYIEICNIIKEFSSLKLVKDFIMDADNVSNFNQCFTYVLGILDLDLLSKCTLDGDILILERSFLVKGVDQTADDIQNNMNLYQSKLDGICKYLNEFLVGMRGKKIEATRMGTNTRAINSRNKKANDDSTEVTVLVTTNFKANSLKQSTLDVNICGELKFNSAAKGQTIISSNLIDNYIQLHDALKIKLETYLGGLYKSLILLLSKFVFYAPLTRMIAVIDYIVNNAKNAIKYKYFRPELINDPKRSYLIGTDIRHPIIERILNNEYIPNDVQLDEKKTGYLLYGINSSGKSSYSKAVALNIVMAQAGMFVPSKIKLSPYYKIITRLSGHDDIFKGYSSFVVEMMELRTILRNADEKTLVIADELCRGTESISGISITIATIQELLKRNSSFIISTHLHEIPDIIFDNYDIRGLNDKTNAHVTKSNTTQSVDYERLHICHLSSDYDPVSKLLIYDRKLKDGAGSSLYGLEVAKSVDIDNKFIENANSIRRKLIDDDGLIINNKISRYNAQVVLTQCLLCDGRDDLQTHHLAEQSNADDSKFINYFHKDSKFNLVSLCKQCHQKLHASKMTIVPKQSVNGVIYVMINL